MPKCRDPQGASDGPSRKAVLQRLGESAGALGQGSVLGVMDSIHVRASTRDDLQPRDGLQARLVFVPGAPAWPATEEGGEERRATECPRGQLRSRGDEHTRPQDTCRRFLKC